MKLFSLTQFIFNFLFFVLFCRAQAQRLSTYHFLCCRASVGFRIGVGACMCSTALEYQPFGLDVLYFTTSFFRVHFSISFFTAGLVHAGIRRNPLGACWLHMELPRSSAIFVAECLASREIERIILFLQLPLQIVVRGLDLSVVRYRRVKVGRNYIHEALDVCHSDRLKFHLAFYTTAPGFLPGGSTRAELQQQSKD